ncbi:hypothetical protein G7Y89_g14473 [Cudoniella acicularis]|uniref:FAD/NAD(P)-binding domain-containing protein n=1 Tax=Cudoniella acicularis TaxID=354080 RepID=A0A8H4R288_9HELO|nr:hypothetical protein G7Y89_g14473 [Cudoniella acicularis]
MTPPNTTKENGPTKILIIGASYAGLAAGLNLLDLCQGRSARFSSRDSSSSSSSSVAEKQDGTLGVKSEVLIKIVDERDGFYHLIGTPLALASTTYASKAWHTISSIPALHDPSISFLQGSAIHINPSTKTATVKLATSNAGKEGDEIEEGYDFLVAASGLRRKWPTVPQSLTREEYLRECKGHIEKVTSGETKEMGGVVVVGGGSSILPSPLSHFPFL